MINPTMMKNKSVCLLCFSMILSCTSEKSPPIHEILKTFRNPASNEILIAAHRAVHLTYPENSLAAIQHAMDMGVAIIEIDVRQTADGVLVLMHDKTIDRTSTGHGRIDSLLWNDVQKITLKTGSADSGKLFIPSLEQALLLGKNHLMFDLDVKSAALPDLVSLIQKTGTQRQVMFFNHNFAVLDTLLMLDPSLLVLPRAETVKELQEILSRFITPVIQINDSIFTAPVDSLIKATGANVWVNSLGKFDRLARKDSVAEAYSQFVKGNADIVQTDNPDLWLEFLRDQNAKR